MNNNMNNKDQTKSSRRFNRCHQATNQIGNKIKTATQTCINYLNNIPHVKERQMTYFTHMLEALELGSGMFLGGICLFIHAFIPEVFQMTGSTMIKTLNEQVVKKSNTYIKYDSKMEDLKLSMIRNDHR